LELEDKIARSEVIDISKLKGDVIRFGATVTLEDDHSGDVATYQIVGEHESDISACRLSIASPLARALISKTVNDTIELSTPRGTKSYTILQVQYIDA
jgi:transcription elongation factor GreA